MLDAEEDIFRDLELEGSDTLEDFHNSILQSFGLEGNEMASFYLSDEEWKQGDEIVLYEVGEGDESPRIMEETLLQEIASTVQTRFIYLYDFLNMWTFLVELADIAKPESGKTYPNLMFSHGQLPPLAPERGFTAEEGEEDDEFGSDYDDGYDVGDYDDLDFDENWN